jgi:hypothetical protein
VHVGDAYKVSATVRSRTEEMTLTMIVDTAAGYSCIHPDTIPADAKIEKATERMPRVVGANGLPLDINGFVDLEVTLGYTVIAHRFLVVSRLPYAALLGVPFIENHVRALDCENGNLLLNAGTHVPLTSKGHKAGGVYLQRTIILPPMSEMHVQCRARGIQGTVELSSAMFQKGVRTANAVAVVEGNWDILLKIANFTEK